MIDWETKFLWFVQKFFSSSWLTTICSSASLFTVQVKAILEEMQIAKVTHVRLKHVPGVMLITVSSSSAVTATTKNRLYSHISEVTLKSTGKINTSKKVLVAVFAYATPHALWWTFVHWNYLLRFKIFVHSYKHTTRSSLFYATPLWYSFRRLEVNVSINCRVV